jgi:hypothetical protein
MVPMKNALRFMRQPQIVVSVIAGVLTALGLWLLWPMHPRAVLPATDHCAAVFFAPEASRW